MHILVLSLCEQGSIDDIHDLLFSLFPDMASKVDERKLQNIIDTLGGKSESALSLNTTVFPSVERGLQNENDIEHESMGILRSLLENHNFPQTDPIDSDTLYYLLNIWGGTEPRRDYF